jgi:hypothetical protein
MNIGFAAKAGAVVVIVGLVVAFVNQEKRRAAAEERYSILAEKYVDDSTAHANYVIEAWQRRLDDSVRTAALSDSFNASKAAAGWWAGEARRNAQAAEDAWEEAREELDPADYNEIRLAYDTLEEAHDKCSLALKDCGTLTAQLETEKKNLEADLAESAKFDATSAATIQNLRVELADANKTDWLPWGIAVGASTLLLAIIIAG